MIKIGITGTIGSGKTFALNFFKSKRIKTFSADFEVKNILKGILVKEKIFKISGRKLVDTLQIPKEKNTIHVIGNLPEKSKKYSVNHFLSNIRKKIKVKKFIRKTR